MMTITKAGMISTDVSVRFELIWWKCWGSWRAETRI